MKNEPHISRQSSVDCGHVINNLLQVFAKELMPRFGFATNIRSVYDQNKNKKSKDFQSENRLCRSFGGEKKETSSSARLFSQILLLFLSGSDKVHRSSKATPTEQKHTGLHKMHAPHNSNNKS